MFAKKRTDEDLFLDYRDNNNIKSFNLLEKRLNGWMVNRINFKIDNHSDAEDIAQKVWIKVIEKKNDYIAGNTLKNWLFYRIARGYIQHYLRDKKNSRLINPVPINQDGEEIDFLDSRPSTESLPIQTLEAYEKSLMIRKALGKLNANHQDAFILHNCGNMELADIAELLKTNENTVKTWHRRAKERLSALLHKYYSN